MATTRPYRFCVQVQMFNVDNFILPMLENCGPHVERIYVARSEKPWGYNREARERIKNPTPVSLLDQSPWRDKITLIEGEWETDHAQRNALLERAIADGMDYMIVQDADEFYQHEDFQHNLRVIAENPDYDAYGVRWYVFWKDVRHIITDRYGRPMDDGWINFAVNCHGKMKFDHMRFTTAKDLKIFPGYLPGPAHHLSYVMSDEVMLNKLSTWSHTNDFDWRSWYEKVWLKWWPGRWHLAPVKPWHWARAVPFKGLLPEVLKDFQGPEVTSHMPTFGERLLNELRGRLTLIYYKAKMPLYFMRKRLRSRTKR